MGIKGLYHFMSRYHGGVSELINMPEEIQKWKIQNNGHPPTILIDMKEMAQIFMRHGTAEMNAVFGGCFTYYLSHLKQFLASLVNMDVKLVFFLTGRKYSDDLQLFIQARESIYINCLDVLDKIEGYSDCKELEAAFRQKFQTFRCDFRMNSSFEFNMDRFVRRYGEIHVNYEQHNQEIARYAKKHANEVLAIITNDTNFMAFEGDFQFWKANNTNVFDMTCYRYCRRTLCADLGLNFYQIQLLGALSGTQYLPIHIVSDFLNRLADANDDPTKIGKIWNVSTYIKKQPYEVVDNKPKFNLKDISRDVFGEEYTLEQLNCIKKSLQMYDLDFVDDREPEDSFLKKHSQFLYKLFTSDTFCVIDIEFIDFRHYKSKSYAQLIMPLLMKMCGIMFKNNSPRPKVRKICMKHAHDDPFRVTDEDIIYPPVKLPELHDLIFKNRGTQWLLLAWLLDLNANFIKTLLQSVYSDHILKNLITVIITLKYLLENGELTAHEANAILMTEYKISKSGSSKVELQNVPNIRFIRIAHLYVKMFVLISHCMDICGFRHMTNLIRFDGPCFLKTMDEFETSYDQLKQKLNAAGLNFFTKS